MCYHFRIFDLFYWLIEHVIPFQQRTGYLLGTFSETEFESSHSKFKPIEQNYRGKYKELAASLGAYNAPRVQKKEIKKRRKVSFSQPTGGSDKKESAFVFIQKL